MANYGYGWYTQEQLEDYYDQLIGNIFNIPSIFRITLCFVVKQAHSHPDQSGALVNVDVLDTVHPKSKLKGQA